MRNDTFSGFIDELKTKCNIVDVVSRYVTLDRKGSTHWACCPIHNEKTPSFAVSEDKGTYMCFGCHASGDVFSFIMQMESCTFMDAVKILADRVGMTVPEFNKDKNDFYKERKDRMYSIMRDSAVYYHGNISLPSATSATDYITRRKLTMQTVRAFGLGYSLGFTELPKYLAEKGYTEAEMVDSGVCDTKNGKLYDAQAGRLIVPIINNIGKVIAFGGRLLEDADFAKYKNTKETIIFEKRKELFGFTNLKKAKQEGRMDSVIVVEGYMDVISLCQAGINNVCASMGTALTPEQCKSLKFYSNNVFLCYDGDSAGQKATYRGIDIVNGQDLTLKVVQLPDGLDPDDVIKKLGKEKFQSLLKEAIAPMEYKLSNIAKNYNFKEPSEQGKFTLEAIKLLSELKSVVEQEAYLPLIRDMSGLTLDSIRHEFNNLNAIATSVGQANAASSMQVKRKQSAILERYYKAARYVLNTCYTSSVEYDYSDDLISYFEDDEHKKIYNYARYLRDIGEPINIGRLNELEECREAERIAESAYTVDAKCRKQMFEDNINALKVGYLQMKVEELTAQAVTEPDMATKKQLLIKIQELNILMREFK